ncbi:hypothetical protein [Sphingobacterium griseoflavum]|uniref:hypothetical protein n=1 Tax=Sphingobacterium griseoflavum TaxID=1474952 RepID=UPI0016785AF5|nr:hypothetical protein [Sphingobacterium griseoflavum]
MKIASLLSHCLRYVPLLLGRHTFPQGSLLLRQLGLFYPMQQAARRHWPGRLAEFFSCVQAYPEHLRLLRLPKGGYGNLCIARPTAASPLLKRCRKKFAVFRRWAPTVFFFTCALAAKAQHFR